MTVNEADTARLFPHFLDPVDMIGCFPATTTLGEVNAAAGAHGLRFPLVCDPGQTLLKHLAVAEFTSASARFGAYVDNVPGMNWRLPSGRLVRLGERVVKSTTGYDLQRFLLHSDDRFGEAVDFVLRLRPIGGELLRGHFHGSDEQLLHLTRLIRKSSWNHWIDSVDWVIPAEGQGTIEVFVDCLPGESAIFNDSFQKIASEAMSTFSQNESPSSPGLPALSIKALPSEVLGLARHCVSRHGGRARILVMNGYIHVQPAGDFDPGWIQELTREVANSGGHVFGKSLQAGYNPEMEEEWIQTLQDKWGKL